MVTLLEPYRGYTVGQLTGKRDGYRHEVQFTSGMTAFFYEDEFQAG